MSMSLSAPPLVVITGNTGEGAVPVIFMPKSIPLNFDPELLYAGHSPIGWQIPDATNGIATLCDQCALSPMGVRLPISAFLSSSACTDLSFLRELTNGGDVNVSIMQIGAAVGQQRLCIIVNLGHVFDNELGRATANGTSIRCVTRTGLAFNEAIRVTSATDEILLGTRLAHYLLQVPHSPLAVMPSFRDVPDKLIVVATSNLQKQTELMEALNRVVGQTGRRTGIPVLDLPLLALALSLDSSFFHNTPTDYVGDCPRFFGNPQDRAQLLADRLFSILSLVSLMRPDLAGRMLVVGDTACLVVKGEDGPNGLPVDQIMTMAAARMVDGIPSVCLSQQSGSGVFAVPEVSGRRMGVGMGFDPYLLVNGNRDGNGSVTLEKIKERVCGTPDRNRALLREVLVENVARQLAPY